ncbi:MAG: lipopolysaccharide kinase InaA family protein [Planctomycetota bacterium]|nr:lipopolysaccharide kinase InaA family protein [Planctomycetota bacterium]
MAQNSPDNSEETPRPPGFVQQDKESARLWLREDYQDLLLSLPVEEPARLARHNPAPLSGRGVIGLVNVDKDGEKEKLIIRPYLRGGLMGRLFHDRYFDDGRAINELELYREAQKRGIPSLEVLGAVTRPCRGMGYRHGIITRYLEDVHDLAAVLLNIRDEKQRRAAMREAGRVIRVMHDQGFNHPDLNIKNVLVRFRADEDESDDSAVEAWVIDFDRGHFVTGALDESARRGNLMRLIRSFVKFHKKAPGAVTFREPLELAHGYFAGEPKERMAFLDLARRALKKSLRIRLTSWRAKADG